tara:strand:+ start:414 stop:1541 length:1128 start_codon:yes stop_codon:yes gene_type:complete
MAGRPRTRVRRQRRARWNSAKLTVVEFLDQNDGWLKREAGGRGELSREVAQTAAATLLGTARRAREEGKAELRYPETRWRDLAKRAVDLARKKHLQLEDERAGLGKRPFLFLDALGDEGRSAHEILGSEAEEESAEHAFLQRAEVDQLLSDFGQRSPLERTVFLLRFAFLLGGPGRGAVGGLVYKDQHAARALARSGSAVRRRQAEKLAQRAQALQVLLRRAYKLLPPHSGPQTPWGYNTETVQEATSRLRDGGSGASPAQQALIIAGFQERLLRRAEAYLPTRMYKREAPEMLIRRTIAQGGAIRLDFYRPKGKKAESADVYPIRFIRKRRQGRVLVAADVRNPDQVYGFPIEVIASATVISAPPRPPRPARRR